LCHEIRLLFLSERRSGKNGGEVWRFSKGLDEAEAAYGGEHDRPQLGANLISLTAKGKGASFTRSGLSSRMANGVF